MQYHKINWILFKTIIAPLCYSIRPSEHKRYLIRHRSSKHETLFRRHISQENKRQQSKHFKTSLTHLDVSTHTRIYEPKTHSSVYTLEFSPPVVQWTKHEWYTSWTLSHSRHTLYTHTHTHMLSCYLLSIPLGCHGVPMATYIYTTWLQRRADLSLVAAVDFGRVHTKATEPGERETEKETKDARQGKDRKMFCFRSEYWRHMSPVQHLFAVARRSTV